MSYPPDTRSANESRAEELLTPVVPLCPSCRSGRVTTTGNAESDATYWRCLGCGDVWNPGRMAASRTTSLRSRW
jgi:hypothetical protein